MNYRNLFEGVNQPIQLEHGKIVIPINFDNAATTPPFQGTIREMNQKIQFYGSIGRSTGQKSEFCTKLFEDTRKDLLDFFDLGDAGSHTAIYVKSTTEGLNLLANALIKNKREIVLTTRMEHHSNDLPWRYAATVDYIEVDRYGRIHIKDIENKLMYYKGRVRYVAVTAASNVTGYLNDLNKIARLCHQYGAFIVVDGAQIVAHREVNLAGSCAEEMVDFFVFSAHKAYAPFGSGAIIGLKAMLENSTPYLKGGGAVSMVGDHNVIWNLPPDRMEAGTQNFFGVIAMRYSLMKLKSIGFSNIEVHEDELRDYLLENMKKINSVILYGDSEHTKDRLGIICFRLRNQKSKEVAERLSKEYGIAVRYGKFCAHPYVNRLLQKGDTSIQNCQEDDMLIRLSIGLYNTREEAEIFLQRLKTISAG